MRPSAPGVAGNEVLTSATAAVLVVLLLALGVTIIDLGGLLREHMFLGMLLLGPVALKFASTGYRFARYYTHARAYVAKGPPATPMRVLAPLLVTATVVVFATGVWLLALGRRSDLVLELHKVSFIVWGAVFGIHFLVYLPHVARSLARDWTAVRGAALRASLVVLSLGAGLGVALATLSLITSWHG